MTVSPIRPEKHAYQPAAYDLCARCGYPEPFGALHTEAVREHVETHQVWQRGDVVQNPATGYLFTAVGDGEGGMRWVELAPAAAHAQDHPPQDAVLLCRRIDGHLRPVVDLGDGDLFAVRVV